jgi:hypothetical protein
MTFKIRLISTWRTIILSIILVVISLSLILFLTKGALSEIIIILIVFPIIFGSMILSATLNSRIRTIEISDKLLKLEQSLIIPIDQIDSCRVGESFLISGLMVKMKNKKTFHFHALRFLANPNFQLFKDFLVNKSLDQKIIPVQTKQDYLRESKILRYGSNVLLIAIVVLSVLKTFSIVEISTIQLIYYFLISSGLFLTTRK